MPVSRLVCPHCEQSVEVQMTSVTRSRECPRCGKSIILQTSARDGRQPRRALLVPGIGAHSGDSAGQDAAPGTGPRVLSGDPRDRMMLDPEVRRTAARLKWGLVFFGALLLGVLAWHQFRLGAALSNVVGQQAGPAVRGAPESAPAVASPPSRPVPSLSEPKPVAKSPAEPPASGPSLVPEVPLGPQLTDQQQAMKAAIAFMNAATVEERLDRVRDRRMNEERIRSYYARQGDRPLAFERVEPLEVNAMGPFTYSFNVVLPDGARRKIMMGKAQSGDYMADWASFVIYSEMSWDEFRAKRPEAPVMFRVLADREEMFGRQFNDPQGLLCIRMLNPLDPGAPPIYGYAAKSSPTARALAFVMDKNPGQPVPLMLKLSFPKDSATDYQVWITEFIGEGWIARNW